MPALKALKYVENKIISLYADDTTVFVRDLDSIAHLLSLFDKFKNLSGLESNTKRPKECGSVAGKITLKRRLGSAGHGSQ